MSGEWVVEAWHAAMETTLLWPSVNPSITPLVTSASQTAVVAGLAVNTAGLTPGGGRMSMVSSDWFIEVL